MGKWPVWGSFWGQRKAKIKAEGLLTNLAYTPAPFTGATRLQQPTPVADTATAEGKDEEDHLAARSEACKNVECNRKNGLWG